MEELLRNLISEYILKLEKNRNSIKIKSLGKPIKFNTSKIIENEEKILLIEKKPFVIYIIRTNEKITYEIALNGYKSIKSKGFGPFRVNDEKKDNHFDYWKTQFGEQCLYVGSSKDIRKRLKEHLGLIGKTTFSLHLSEWYKNKVITVELYEVSNEEEMHLYEDLLWDEYKPLLGKQGRR